MVKYGNNKDIVLSTKIRINVNGELMKTVWKKVTGASATWGTSCKVRADRLCPDCVKCFKIAPGDMRCRNGRCPECDKWYCMRCMTVMQNAGDHSCGNCSEAGVQQIVDGKLKYLDDGKYG